MSAVGLQVGEATEVEGLVSPVDRGGWGPSTEVRGGFIEFAKLMIDQEHVVITRLVEALRVHSEVFQLFDDSGDGSITAAELGHGLSK